MRCSLVGWLLVALVPRKRIKLFSVFLSAVELDCSSCDSLLYDILLTKQLFGWSIKTTEIYNPIMIRLAYDFLLGEDNS